MSFSFEVYHESLGFNKKDLDKITEINQRPNTEGLMVTFVLGLTEDKMISPVHLLKSIPAIEKRKYFNDIRVNKLIFSNIIEYVKKNHFDIVLMRYQMAHSKIYELSKVLNEKLFFEHNSNELTEFKFRVNERRSKLKFSLKPGYFIYLLEGKILPILLENYYGPKIRKKVSTGFAVTYEIGEHQKSISKNYEVCVIANGVKFNSDCIHKSVSFDGAELKLFMLLGTRASWHGVDRLINGLNNYKGNVKIQIDIIGYYMPENKELVNQLEMSKQISFVEPILPDEMTKVLQGYHLAIGTLGLHRKDLNEASTLKVRESLMRGFPVVLGYKDTDFINENILSEYVHILPSDESHVNFDEVVSFANVVLNQKNSPSLIHKKSEAIISYRVKIDQMMKFISLGSNK